MNDIASTIDRDAPALGAFDRFLRQQLISQMAGLRHGRLLLDDHGGEATHLVEAAGHRAEHLVELLRTAEHFDDRRTYRGLDVPFYKRAQIAAADLHAALGGEGPGRFDDLDRLTIFADEAHGNVVDAEAASAGTNATAAPTTSAVPATSPVIRRMDIIAPGVAA